jgi:hypothetical protein
MNPQIAQHGQRFNEFAGPGGFHEGGQDAGWWIISILAILLMIVITGLLVWIGRTAAELRSSLVMPAAINPIAAPVPDAAASTAPSLMADPEAPTEVAPNKPTT